MTRIRRPNPRPGGTRAEYKLSKQVAAEEPICWLRFPRCTVRSETADHYWPVKYRPDLKMVRSNLRGSCHRCNRTRGATPPQLIPALRAKLEGKAMKRTSSKPALRFFG